VSGKLGFPSRFPAGKRPHDPLRRPSALSHFRSHRRTRLDLDGRPWRSIGPNGAGKTNLMEAVSLLSPGRGLRRATAEEIIRRPEAIGWKVTRAGRRSRPRATRSSFPPNPASPRQRAHRRQGRAQTALARLMRIVWLVPAQDRLWIEGAEGRRRFFDRMTMSFVPDHAEAVLTYEKAMRERNRLLKDEVRDPALVRRAGTPDGRGRGGDRRQPRRRARPPAEAQEGRGNGLSPPISDARGQAGPPETADLALAFADGRPRDMAAGRTLTGPHRADLGAIYTDKDVPARQCSTGEQKALLISLVLANARGAQDGNRRMRPSCCSTRSPPISTPAAAPRFSTRSARSAPRPG
jgi:DNA replication and repair protein RecF